MVFFHFVRSASISERLIGASFTASAPARVRNSFHVCPPTRWPSLVVMISSSIYRNPLRKESCTASLQFVCTNSPIPPPCAIQKSGFSYECSSLRTTSNGDSMFFISSGKCQRTSIILTECSIFARKRATLRGNSVHTHNPPSTRATNAIRQLNTKLLFQLAAACISHFLCDIQFTPPHGDWEWPVAGAEHLPHPPTGDPQRWYRAPY